MPSAQYEVLLSLRAEGDLTAKVGAMAGKVHEHISGIGDIGRRVGDVLGGIADKALDVATTFAKWGVAGAIGLATYGVMGLNKELETTTISLAAIFNRQGFVADFAGGMQLAGQQLSKMKQDVKTLPGDLGQLAGIMTMIATPAGAAGAGADDIRKLAGRTMLTSTILGVPMEVAQREMAGLLSGRAGSHNILGSRLGLIGDAAKKFNEASPEDRLKKINVELDKYKSAADTFGGSFVAQWTTLKDNIKYGILSTTTAPLFEHVKRTLGEINDYFDKNKDRVDYLTFTVGHKLADAWDYVIDKIKSLEPYLARAADLVAHLQIGDIAKGAEKFGSVYSGLKLAGAGLGAGGIGGIASAVIGAGVIGEGMALGSSDQDTREEARTALKNLSVAFIGLTATLNKDVSPAFEKFGIFATNRATDLANVTNEILEGLEEIGHAATHWGQTVEEAAEITKALVAANNRWIGDIERRKGDLDAQAGWGNQFGVALDPGKSFGLGTEQKKRESASTTIQKVEIIVKGSDDPSRVARLTAAELKKFAANPTRSKFAYNPAEPNMGG